MLRQDPVECLFEFICSSNNHISRIHGMVERLCSKYGTPLQPLGGFSTPPDQVCHFIHSVPQQENTILEN